MPTESELDSVGYRIRHDRRPVLQLSDDAGELEDASFARRRILWKARALMPSWVIAAEASRRLVHITEVAGSLGWNAGGQNLSHCPWVEARASQGRELHPSHACLHAVRPSTHRRGTPWGQFALEHELDLMCSQVFLCELVMLRDVIPYKEEPANSHLTANLFQALALQSVGHCLPVRLPATRQTVPVAVGIAIPDKQDASILHHNRLGRYSHLSSHHVPL